MFKRLLSLLLVTTVLCGVPTVAHADMQNSAYFTQAEQSFETRLSKNGFLSGCKVVELEAVGSKNITVDKSKHKGLCYIQFTAPKAGKYQIKLSNLKSDSEGAFMGIWYGDTISAALLESSEWFQKLETAYVAKSVPADAKDVDTKTVYTQMREMVKTNKKQLKSSGIFEDYVLKVKLKKGDEFVVATYLVGYLDEQGQLVDKSDETYKFAYEVSKIKE